MAPTALSIKKDPSLEMYKKAGLEDKMLYLPLFYGLLSVVVFFLASRLLPLAWQKYWIIGIFFGLIYPTLGVISKLPQKVYGTTNYFLFYLSAILLYTFFYGIVIAWTVENIC